MAFDFAVSIYDDDKVERLGKPGEVGFNFTGMTARQAQAGLKYLRSITAKLEDFIAKNGDDEGGDDVAQLEAEGSIEGEGVSAVSSRRSQVRSGRWFMSPIEKHGTGDGRIIPEEDDNTKLASEQWSDKDRKELEDELARDDRGQGT